MKTKTNRLTKKFDILNGEGTILGLYESDEKLILSSFLKNNKGNVFYPASLKLLKGFINSEFPLKELLDKSLEFEVNEGQGNSLSKNEILEQLFGGEKKYSDFPDSLKDRKFEEYILAS